MNSSLVDGRLLGGDGSELYPGDGVVEEGPAHVDCAGYSNPLVFADGLDYNCSRILQVKEAVREVLGEPFDGAGLMRFSQQEATSDAELLGTFSSYYQSDNNVFTATSYDSLACGSYDYAEESFWLQERGSPEAHAATGGDLLVEIPVSDGIDTRGRVALWLDHLEEWSSFATWSEIQVTDDGGYALAAFTNKELRVVNSFSMIIGTIHEAWTYMRWLRGQDPNAETRRYLVFALADGVENCGGDVADLDVYWQLQAPQVMCQERFASDQCPAIELYQVLFPEEALGDQAQDIADVAWSGSTDGSFLSQGRAFATSSGPEAGEWMRGVLSGALGDVIFFDGFENGSTAAWSSSVP